MKTQMLALKTWRDLQVIMRGKRTPQTTHLAFDTQVEIREVDKSDLTLAVKLRTQGGEDGEYIFHQYDGRLIREVEVGAHGHHSHIMGADIQACFGGSYRFGWKNPFSREHITLDLQPVQTRDLPRELGIGVKTVVFDGTERRQIELQRFVSERYLIVDNTLWETAPEPCWVAKIGKTDANVAIDLSGSSPAENSFRLDRLDAAKKLAAIVGRKEKSSETRYEIHTGSWIEHLDASVLRRNDRLLVAQSICERIVEGATHRWLRLLPPESTAVWSRLRTATRALTKGDASVCDQAAGLAKRIVDDIEALPVNTYGQAWKGYLLDVTRPFLEEPGNVQSPSFNRTSLAETIKRWTRMEGGVFADPDLSAEEIGAISEIAGI